MNVWVFFGGVLVGGFLTSLGFLFDNIRRRNRAWTTEESVRQFEAVVAATQQRRCNVMSQGTVVQSWYCLTHFQGWVGEGECPGHCPCTPDPTRDRTRP